MQERYKYWAFISYSHADEPEAARLHRALETYRVPRQLVGRPSRDGTLPRRLFPVFRDRDELPGASDLSAKIKEALHQSRYLVLVCSPHAVASKWVGEEIRTFKALGREDRVLSVIVGGEPHASDVPETATLECFPIALRRTVDAQGQLTDDTSEPLAADAREGKDGRSVATLKVLAGLLNVGYEELRQREQQRRRRRQMLGAAAVIAFCLATTLAYVLSADAGARVPGYESIQSFVDGRDLSVFRRVPGVNDIRGAARQTRAALIRRLETDARETIEALQAGRRVGKWMRDLPQHEQQARQAMAALSVWDSSQGLYGLLSAPESNGAAFRRYLPILDETFNRDVLIPGYGWWQYRMDYTRAEPSLWSIATLAVMLRTEGLLTDSERDIYKARLAATQAIADVYRPTQTGGWNIFPNQDNPNEASTYTTGLALLALLETKASRLPWDGSTQKVDDLTGSTTQWLIEHFDAKATPPGWPPAPDDRTSNVSDGLTLQIYSTLLRAEDELHVPIPAAIATAIRTHVESLVERTADFPTSNNRFNRAFRNHKQVEIDVRPSTNYLWYPWAIATSAQWLERSGRAGDTVEARVRTRRALAHLVMTLDRNSELTKKTTASSGSYTVAESLYGLSWIEKRGSPP